MQISKYRAMVNPSARGRILSFQRACIWGAAATAITLTIIFGSQTQLEAQSVKLKKSNVTGYYQFNIGDTLAILDEHGKLEGHVDIFQPNEVPKPLLSYNITRGSVNRSHLEFKTQEIYGKRYRFSGTVERGAGKAPGDYDYLQLAGNLETITHNSATGKRKVNTRHIIFKSLAQDRQGS